MELEKIELQQTSLSEEEILDVLSTTSDIDLGYSDIGCAGGLGACKDGCQNGCQTGSKTGGNCQEACKEGCQNGCKDSCSQGCKGGNKDGKE